MIKGFEKLSHYYSNDFNDENDCSFNDIEDILNEQAASYDEDAVEFDDIMSPMYGSDDIVEVANRGGLRRVGIGFTSDSFGTTQSEYSQIKNALNKFIKGESDESVDDAIDIISKYKDKSIKVVFSYARKFNFNDYNQYNDLKILMNKLCLRSLEGRDTIIAVLIGANSKPHIKLAMLAAGEVREVNAIDYICEKLDDEDLFNIAFEALLDIGDTKAVNSMLDIINDTEKDNEQRITFLIDKASYFVYFGNSIIKSLLKYYNNCNQWLRPIFARMIESFEEDVLQDLLDLIEKESDNRKLDSLYRLLGRLNNDKVSEILIDSYNSGKNMKSSIIGLGHIKSESSKKLFRDILVEGREESRILGEAILSLAFMAKNNEVEEYKKLIRPYADSINDRLRINSNLALARLGDSNSLEKYIYDITDNDVYTRNCASMLINRLKIHQITEILDKCLSLPENKVTLALTALTRRKTFNKEAGDILLKLLDKSSYLSNIEIYKIIGNTANTKNEIIPLDVLFDRLDSTSNGSEKMVIEDILSNKSKINRGIIGSAN